MELEELDQRTRKLMTMCRAHDPKADVDELYMQICEGGRGLLGPEDCVQVEVYSFEKYLITSKENILKKVSPSRIIKKSKQKRNKEDIHKNHREKYCYYYYYQHSYYYYFYHYYYDHHHYCI